MISILIPIYNGIEFINDSVISIWQQTYKEWELLIGINGHPPDSDVYKTASKYIDLAPDKIRVFDFYTIRGKSNTLNEMIKHCTYDYVAILDVDDVWHPAKLTLQSVYLHSYDVIGTKCMYIGDMHGNVPEIPTGDISEFDFSIFNPIVNSSAIIKKELCDWEENGIEDYDLWLRLRTQNKKFFNIDHILVQHRIHSNSAFNAKGNQNLVPGLLIKHGYQAK